MATAVIMPKQGLQMTEGTIVQWLYAVGDTVAAGQPLFRMETDKLTIDIDASCDGVLLSILRGEGEVVPITEIIAYIGAPGELPPEAGSVSAASTTSVPTEPVAAKTAPAEPVAQTAAVTSKPVSVTAQVNLSGRVFSTPRARLRAAELGVDVARVNGSGPDGLIIERDILSAAASAATLSTAVSVCATMTLNPELTAVTRFCTASGVSTEAFIAFAFLRATGENRISVTAVDGKTPGSLLLDAGTALARTAELMAEADSGFEPDSDIALYICHSASGMTVPPAGKGKLTLSVALGGAAPSLTLAFDVSGIGTVPALAERLKMLLENPLPALAL